MDQPARKRVLFTFGNHMHWVDMQWLWGYYVLPGSVRDMLHLCRETGIKGNVNFDGVGYEKMAAECPDALAELREAVRKGIIEPVGCSYGQPYGLFHGGESNIRQFTFGVRSVLRLLGARPRAFWEEEFYFFPQLPQVLRGCGYDCANLFFQWTWHTPEIPRENCALILWEGIDGTRIPTLPRNDLNLHQWPEDFELLSHPSPSGTPGVGAGSDGSLSLLKSLPLPAISQWIELMPSRDWMCRSEVLLPKLKELLAHPNYEIVPCTVSEMVRQLLDAASDDRREEDANANEVDSGSKPTSPLTPLPGGEGDIPIRAYTPDEVWHGMTLGKNADRHPRTSRRVEQTILAAESLSAVAGLFGRPYASWDVYPTWELDEAWRELLAAQHHDNHECEGLCGFVGYHQMENAGRLAGEVLHRTRYLLQERAGAPLVDNPTGIARTIYIDDFQTGEWKTATVAPFGYLSAACFSPHSDAQQVRKEDESWVLARPNGIRATVDARTGLLIDIVKPEKAAGDGLSMASLRMMHGGEQFDLPPPTAVEPGRHGRGLIASFRVNEAAGPGRPDTYIRYELAPECDALDIVITASIPRPDPGLNAALRTGFAADRRFRSIRVDSPFAAHHIEGSPAVRRKYPSGDWMTSDQWFEEVSGAITSHSFIDLLDTDESGFLISHCGSQQWFRNERGVDVVLAAYDPWDEERSDMRSQFAFRIEPHARLTDCNRVRRVCDFGGDSRRRIMRDQWLDALPGPPPVGGGGPAEPRTIPPVFGGLEVTNADNVIAHAFFRTNEKDGEHLPDWAGHRMMRESGGTCTHPYVVRLVEWDGEPAEVILKLPGEIALAAKTNLMGEVRKSDSDTRWLLPEPATPPEWARDTNIRWSQVRFTMRPREIATIMADLVMGRKQYRDLDAKREVWATVHRDKESTDAHG